MNKLELITVFRPPASHTFQNAASPSHKHGVCDEVCTMVNPEWFLVPWPLRVNNASSSTMHGAAPHAVQRRRERGAFDFLTVEWMALLRIVSLGSLLGRSQLWKVHLPGGQPDQEPGLISLNILRMDLVPMNPRLIRMNNKQILPTCCEVASSVSERLYVWAYQRRKSWPTLHFIFKIINCS